MDCFRTCLKKSGLVHFQRSQARGLSHPCLGALEQTSLWLLQARRLFNLAQEITCSCKGGV